MPKRPVIGFARRHAFAVLALLALILTAQTLLAAHRVAHDIADHAACSLCVAADHQAGPAPHAFAPLEPARDEPYVPIAAATPVFAFVALYRSRAPPPYLAA
jgi:hypothetical protein